ncbi:hypothetical protein BKA69DRAFT_96236 [Paraphysoderma sedebokerense]|nr:hypothetical protein BKA69DRAFT_96236 [Paraphysoderma sedebokerense]
MTQSHTIYILDYGAGNVRSLVNAVQKLGYHINVVRHPGDIAKANKLIFPGVGAFGAAMDALDRLGYTAPLKAYINSGKPFMGICVGMQTLFLGSEESPQIPGLGIINSYITKFSAQDKSVPHMGWNTAVVVNPSKFADGCKQTDSPKWVNHDSDDTVYYFVHSFAAPLMTDNEDLMKWALTVTRYGSELFVSSVKIGNIFATQFHPEKSGWAGLKVLKSFLSCSPTPSSEVPLATLLTSTLAFPPSVLETVCCRFTKRIIACLDVRTNDAGDLVVTKGDQYDVREKLADGDVRNLGKPVELATRYFREGADEITFLNITSFRNVPLNDIPLLHLLQEASKSVFVPLTIGGGIRDIVEPESGIIKHTALEIAGEYFRSGADKVSIGSDAVFAAERFIANKQILTGATAIEQISSVYGAQAVVISVDPRRIYVSSPSKTAHNVIKTQTLGPNREQFCWYQCTVKGGREGRDLDVIQLVTACEAMGAGEILLNCMDKDGTNSGYDLELIRHVKEAVRIPVIASSGAGSVEHFLDAFQETNVEAALAAGIFHRRQVSIENVKKGLRSSRVLVR